MSENYSLELCEEKHKRLDERLDTHDKRLNNHADRLDKLEQDNVGLKAEIKNLCDNLKSLTAVMKWFIGLMVGSFVAFFFYAIQHNLFK